MIDFCLNSLLSYDRFQEASLLFRAGNLGDGSDRLIVWGEENLDGREEPKMVHVAERGRAEDELFLHLKVCFLRNAVNNRFLSSADVLLRSGGHVTNRQNSKLE